MRRLALLLMGAAAAAMLLAGCTETADPLDATRPADGDAGGIHDDAPSEGPALPESEGDADVEPDIEAPPGVE